MTGKIKHSDDVQINTFTDTDRIANYAKEAVTGLLKQQLVMGDEGKLNPLGGTTRAEAAVIIYRVWQSIN